MNLCELSAHRLEIFDAGIMISRWFLVQTRLICFWQSVRATSHSARVSSVAWALTADTKEAGESSLTAAVSAVDSAIVTRIDYLNLICERTLHVVLRGLSPRIFKSKLLPVQTALCQQQSIFRTTSACRSCANHSTQDSCHTCRIVTCFQAGLVAYPIRNRHGVPWISWWPRQNDKALA